MGQELLTTQELPKQDHHQQDLYEQASMTKMKKQDVHE